MSDGHAVRHFFRIPFDGGPAAPGLGSAHEAFARDARASSDPAAGVPPARSGPRTRTQSGYTPAADAVACDLERELKTHRALLVRLARWQLGSAAAAEDAVQETLLAALQGAHRFVGQSSVKTWLIGILKHKIVDAIRHQSRERPLELGDDETSLADVDALFDEGGNFKSAPADWGNPEAALTQQRFFQALEHCLERLPKATARAFCMREVMGMGTDEICAELGITPANCWVMLYRARVALRAGLEQTWFGGDRATRN